MVKIIGLVIVLILLGIFASVYMKILTTKDKKRKPWK